MAVEIINFVSMDDIWLPFGVVVFSLIRLIYIFISSLIMNCMRNAHRFFFIEIVFRGNKCFGWCKTSSNSKKSIKPLVASV